MTYGCPVWCGAAAGHMKRLQVIQNKNLKTIYGLPWRFSTVALNRMTGFERLDELVKKTTTVFYARCAESEHDLIRKIAAEWA